MDKKGQHSNLGTTEDLEQNLGLKLMECWGRPSPRLVHLLELMTKLKARKSRISSVVRSPAIQKQIRLSEAQVIKLVEEYRGGTTVMELSRRYGIHRTTVMDHLRRKGVPKQGPKLNREQITQAKYLRNMGMSYEKIGAVFGVDGETVRITVRV